MYKDLILFTEGSETVIIKVFVANYIHCVTRSTHAVVHVSENKITFPSLLKRQGKLRNPVDILSLEKKKFEF
jgi:hypothetical protein